MKIANITHLLLICAAVGCGEGNAFLLHSDTADTPAGTLKLATPEKSGMSGSYSHADGSILNFETRHIETPVGGEEISARLFDGCNATLAYVAEGHTPQDWQMTPGCESAHRPLELLAALVKDLMAQPVQTSLLRDRALLVQAIGDLLSARDYAAVMNGGVDVHSGQARRAAAGALKVKVPDWEFKHAIELWSQNYRVPVLNKVTVNHHSGTVDMVFRRATGGDGLWEIQESGRNCNHGSCPGEDEMVRYATCQDTPIIKNVYAIRTDCTGVWGVNHVCNDDSALQINQAYGRGLGVTHCEGKRRANRPWCGVQW